MLFKKSPPPSSLFPCVCADSLQYLLFCLFSIHGIYLESRLSKLHEAHMVLFFNLKIFGCSLSNTFVHIWVFVDLHGVPTLLMLLPYVMFTSMLLITSCVNSCSP